MWGVPYPPTKNIIVPDDVRGLLESMIAASLQAYKVELEIGKLQVEALRRELGRSWAYRLQLWLESIWSKLWHPAPPG